VKGLMGNEATWVESLVIHLTRHKRFRCTDQCILMDNRMSVNEYDRVDWINIEWGLLHIEMNDKSVHAYAAQEAFVLEETWKRVMDRHYDTWSMSSSTTDYDDTDSDSDSGADSVFMPALPCEC